MRKRRARSLEGHVYRRGRIWWFKWTSLDGQRMYRSSGSLERAVAEEVLRAELSRKSKGLPSSPDPWRCRVDELLETLQARYRTEGRRAEVFSLSWSQVGWSGGFVRLEPGMTKNGEGRAFPITPALRALLERRQEYTRRCERAQTRIIPLVFHRKGQPVKSFRR